MVDSTVASQHEGPGSDSQLNRGSFLCLSSIHAEDKELCFHATYSSSASCFFFLGYLDIIVLVGPLRFCTLPHIISKNVNESHCGLL